MSDGVLGIGIVGFGNAAKTFHIPLISIEPRLQLRAIASSRSEVVARDAPDVDATSFEHLLQRDDIDLVVVVGKNTEHAPRTIAALQAGKHVVVEKPMALNLADADAMLNASQQSSRQLFVFHNRRWDNGNLLLQKMLAGKALGQIANCDLFYNRYRPEVAQRWREDGEVGGGMLYDLGPHLLYTALQLFGIPQWVQADVFAQRAGAVVDDYFDITLAFGSTRVRLRSSMLVPANELQTEVHGTKGSFKKFGTDPQADLLKAGALPGDNAWIKSNAANYAEVSTVTVAGSISTKRIDIPTGTYDRFYTGVADCLLNGSDPPISLPLARNVTAIIDAALQSAKEGRRIGIDGLLGFR